MFRHEDNAVEKNCVDEGALDTPTDALPHRPGASIQYERPSIVGDDADIPGRRAPSNHEREGSGDTISLEEARAQFSEEELDRLISHKVLRGKFDAEYWLLEDVERILGMD